MTDPLNRMRAESDWLKTELALRAEIERLRKERDEARRKICEMEAECIVYPPCSPQQYAVRMGWDCFKENSDG